MASTLACLPCRNDGTRAGARTGGHSYTPTGSFSRLACRACGHLRLPFECSRRRRLDCCTPKLSPTRALQGLAWRRNRALAMNPLPTTPDNAPTSPRQLFWAFPTLALQGFGGVMAVVQRELVDRRRWLTTEQFAEDWALAQILPGPNVVNPPSCLESATSACAAHWPQAQACYWHLPYWSCCLAV